MRKRKWFKTAGVAAFAAQLLGGAGLASAVDNAKTCVPTPAFVYGGDPVYTSLTPDNIARWSGSAGYGWNQGSGAEVSYETALANNTDNNTAHPEIYGKWMLMSFMSQRAMPQVNGLNGMRIGFDYSFTDPALGTKEDVSQILVLNFDDGSPTSSWSATPPDCPSTAASDCANDPAKNPSTWTSFKPASVSFLKKIGDGNSTGWTNAGTQWAADHTRVWVWADKSVSPTKYYWRVNMALPIRTTQNDPAASWASPSVYFDPNSFVPTSGTTTKFVPHFWAEMLTDATAAVGGTVPQVIKHFPDWQVDASHPEPTRDSNNVPTKTVWGQAEIGSPRDPALLNGDLPCAGQGLLIEGTTGDNVLWHSAIWNNKGNPNNSASLFDPAGTLYMFDQTHAAQAHNNMSVMVANEGGAAVNPANVHATFLVAPYGSQAANTVWAPLNAGDTSTKGGNDFTCVGGSSVGNTSCAPLPKTFPAIDSTPHDPTLTSLTTGHDAQWDMAQDWVPSPNYVCAVQTSDAPGSLTWWYQQPGFSTPGHLCEKAVYTPTDATGMVSGGSAAGLPGHQCMQVQLSGSGVQFAIKSAFRNMHQAPASLYRETATIDTRGLPKLSGRSYHNIYLYVETRNMPYRDDAGYAPKTYDATMQEYNNINRYCGYVSINGKSRSRSQSEGFDCRGYDPSVPVPSEDFLTKRMPTLLVSAFADTGKTQIIRGKKVPILTPMTSFGQYITHDAITEGKVFGWNAGLEPFANTPFQKVGVDTYRLQIPNDGVGHVVTHVEPLPTKRPTCSGTVNMDIVSLLKAIAPLIIVDAEDANEVNALVDSLQIECVPLHELLTKIDNLDWGGWQSWIHYLITQISATDGCNCK